MAGTRQANDDLHKRIAELEKERGTLQARVIDLKGDLEEAEEAYKRLDTAKVGSLRTSWRERGERIAELEKAAVHACLAFETDYAIDVLRPMFSDLQFESLKKLRGLVSYD